LIYKHKKPSNIAILFCGISKGKEGGVKNLTGFCSGMSSG